MPSITKIEGWRAARSIIMDIVLTERTEFREDIRLVTKLVDGPRMLAVYVDDAFEKTQILISLSSLVEEFAGRDFALDYGKALQMINDRRRREGKTVFPVSFVDEDGNPDNVIYIADYIARRAAMSEAAA
ncbi:hypothetical protein [Brucella pseudogrignonensis]|uniref:hypothetical protein n=1 Tax=Brucella pseudogrignonensis TaxID=419475 RepID=UPI003D98C1D0